jgi:purine-cytosine permease-like protein
VEYGSQPALGIVVWHLQALGEGTRCEQVVVARKDVGVIGLVMESL